MDAVPATELVVIIIWASFWLYWLVSALSMKRGRVPWTRELVIRVVIVAIVLVLVRSGALHGHGINQEAWRDAVGMAVLVLGLAFAVWARLNIGRNWGTPMSRKENPELITSGPYHLVRHPIYAGLVAGLVGTAFALSWLWFFAAALAALYFAYCATVEERNMTSQFPEAYPAYKRSTKWFVPFLL